MGITMTETHNSSSDANIWYRYEVDGNKYTGTASGGGSNYIQSTALSGSVEENIIKSGTGRRSGYSWGVTRQTLYDNSSNFFTDKVTASMALSREDTGAITDTTVSGMLKTDRIWIGSTFPTSNTAYAIHGFAPTAPTDWTKVFQWHMIVITSGTGAGQVRRINCVVDDGTTVTMTVSSNWKTNPDNTSVFYICYHPIDLYYASLQSAADGQIGAVNRTPTAAGSGYSVNDVLTVTTGNSDASVQVLAVDGSGGVTSYKIVNPGTGYSTGTGQATSGGSGTGCTINVTAIGWQDICAAWDQTTGRVPLNVEVEGDIVIGDNSTTYWGSCDFQAWGIGVGITSHPWNGTQPTYSISADTNAYYGECDWGTDDTTSVVKAEGNAATFGKITRSRCHGGAGGFSASSSSTVKASRKHQVGITSGSQGSGGSSSHTAFRDDIGNTVSYYNVGMFLGMPKTTRSVGDVKVYEVGGWWGTASPFQTGLTPVVATYEGMKGYNQADTTTVGSFGLGWLYNDNYGLSYPRWYNGSNTNCDVLNQMKNADGSQCNWWSHSYTGYGADAFDLWFERKSIQYTVTDENDNPIEGATVTIKNARGEVVSYEDTGADITADMTNTQTTMNVDLRENLTTGEEVFVDFEYIDLGTVSGSGAGTLSGITREADLPIHFRKTEHKYNTAGYNKNIFRRTSLKTDSNGQTTKQYLVAYSHCVVDHNDGAYASQVTKGGVNYTCNADHFSEDGVNDPPNASYWDVGGTEGFPWQEDYYYAPQDGGSDKISWTKHGPFTITIKKAGYITYNDTFDPTIDFEKTEKTVKLQKIPIFIDQEQVLV